MEWFDVISRLIGNLGFPVVCCGALFWYVTTHTDKQHEEMQELKSIVEKNTDILKDLKDLIATVLNHE